MELKRIKATNLFFAGNTISSNLQQIGDMVESRRAVFLISSLAYIRADSSAGQASSVSNLPSITSANFRFHTESSMVKLIPVYQYSHIQTLLRFGPLDIRDQQMRQNLPDRHIVSDAMLGKQDLSSAALSVLAASGLTFKQPQNIVQPHIAQSENTAQSGVTDSNIMREFSFGDAPRILNPLGQWLAERINAPPTISKENAFSPFEPSLEKLSFSALVPVNAPLPKLTINLQNLPISQHINPNQRPSDEADQPVAPNATPSGTTPSVATPSGAIPADLSIQAMPNPAGPSNLIGSTQPEIEQVGFDLLGVDPLAIDPPATDPPAIMPKPPADQPIARPQTGLRTNEDEAFPLLIDYFGYQNENANSRLATVELISIENGQIGHRDTQEIFNLPLSIQLKNSEASPNSINHLNIIPAQDFFGTITLAYRLYSAAGISPPATLVIQVTQLFDDAPTLPELPAITIAENIADLGRVEGGLSIEEGTSLSYHISGDNPHEITLSADGALSVGGGLNYETLI